MPVALKPGSRLFSTVCSTELMVVKAPAEPVEVTIGGAPPVTSPGDRLEQGTPGPGHDGGTALGKRYVDAAGRCELLCIRAGDGAPALDGAVLTPKEAKPLPASD